MHVVTFSRCFGTSQSQVQLRDEMLLSVGASVLLSASVASAQFVQAPSNLTSRTGHAGVGVRYKEVPTGICEQDPNVRSYSGFADVSENEHMFRRASGIRSSASCEENLSTTQVGYGSFQGPFVGTRCRYTAGIIQFLACSTADLLRK